ncbi:hypothetical protein CRENBAI_002906, partial [Crenichthys baileyi]
MPNLSSELASPTPSFSHGPLRVISEFVAPESAWSRGTFPVLYPSELAVRVQCICYSSSFSCSSG